MSFDIENPEALLLIKTFEKHKVLYLIVGGFAVNRHGYHRTTGDLNIYLKDSKHNRKKLVEALRETKYGDFDILLHVPIIAGYCEILMDDGMYADLMTDIPGLNQLDFEQYFSMALIDEIEGVKIMFLHYNHLISNKKATNRLKDQLDVIELEKINNTTL